MTTTLVKTLLAIAQEVYKVNPLDKCRATNYVWSRFAMVVVLRAENYPYSFIKQATGLHHTTAMAALRRHKDYMEVDKVYQNMFNQFIIKVNMPSLQKMYTLEITPEQFLNACSPTELMEIEMLLYSPAVRARMNADSETENQIQLGQ